MTDQHRLERRLGNDGPDPGCDAAFAMVDEYAEARVDGTDQGERFAGLRVHLANCDACREDVEGLIALVRAGR